MLEDKSGNLWFGTYAEVGGVSHYNGSTWRTFTTADGLADNVVASMLEDKSGNLWFGTTRGMSPYEPDRVAPQTLFVSAPLRLTYSRNLTAVFLAAFEEGGEDRHDQEGGERRYGPGGGLPEPLQSRRDVDVFDVAARSRDGAAVRRPGAVGSDADGRGVGSGGSSRGSDRWARRAGRCARVGRLFRPHTFVYGWIGA